MTTLSDALPLLTEIVQELNRAETKHPNWVGHGDIIYAAAIVQEECGEMIRASVQYVLEGGELAKVREEAIQTAAMCIRMIQNLPS